MSLLLHNKPKFIILPPQSKYIIKKAAKTKHKPEYDASFKKSNTVFVQSVKQFNKLAYKSLEDIKKQLNEVMQTLINEQKKNQFLKQIIGILKQDVQKIEQEQIYQQRIKNIENMKMAKKIQYDMQQILQKHNQQIFKINNLKIQVSASRSQRLVFSNLFKKIENQIKSLENHYYQLIIKNQQYKQGYNNSLTRNINRQLSDQTPPQLNLALSEQKTPLTTKSIINQRSIKQPFFLTGPTIKPYQKTVSSIIINEQGRKKQKKKNSSFQQNIKEIEHNIEHILNKVGFTSIEESIAHFLILQEDNQHLIKQIDHQNSMIFQTEQQISRINFQNSHNDIYEARQLFNLERLPSERRTRTKGTLGQDEDQQECSDHFILQGIKRLLGLDKNESNQYLSQLDALKAIDEKIQNVIQIKPNNSINKPRENFERRRYNLTQSAEVLFSKMQKYELCDRIFSKKQFIQEYQNEKVKNKKTLKPKRLHL